MKKIFCLFLSVCMTSYTMKNQPEPSAQAEKQFLETPKYLLHLFQEARANKIDNTMQLQAPQVEPKLPSFIEPTSVVVFDDSAIALHSLEYREAHAAFKKEYKRSDHQYKASKTKLRNQLNKLKNLKAISEKDAASEKIRIFSEYETLNKETQDKFKILMDSLATSEKLVNDKESKTLQEVAKKLRVGIVLYKKQCAYLDGAYEITDDVYAALNFEYAEEKRKQAQATKL